ncbi:MAG: hypothetical protein O2894_08360, partial [Planctomycetota bacterium]|nr:hypothetical protein [Planctomycetota bacterium]
MQDVLLFDPELEPWLRAAGVVAPADLLALGDPLEPRRFVGFVTLPGPDGPRAFHVKRYRYEGWRASRGLLGRGTLWGMPPELREFAALRALRAGGIGAV